MAESKESMQSAIKNLQARTENIEKLLEKGNKTIVFQLGSHSIKFEFANEKIPQRVRTLIAY
jgi:actin-related protein